MEHIKSFFVKLKFRIKLDLLAIRAFVDIPLGLIRDIGRHVETKRLLRQCPDEESKNRALREIMQKDQEKHERIMRKMRLHHSLTLASFELIFAIGDQYSYDENSDITEETHLAAPERFRRAKDDMLMNARWMLKDDENNECLKEFIALLEPVEIDTFTTDEEWDEFLKKLWASLTPET